MNTQTTLSRRKKILILLLALIANVAILLFFSIDLPTNPLKIILDPAQIEKEKKLDLSKFHQDKPQPWAALKPKQSRFGAPVIFKDVPEPPNQSQQNKPIEQEHQKSSFLEAPPQTQDNPKEDNKLDKQEDEKNKEPYLAKTLKDEQKDRTPPEPLLEETFKKTEKTTLIQEQDIKKPENNRDKESEKQKIDQQELKKRVQQLRKNFQKIKQQAQANSTKASNVRQKQKQVKMPSKQLTLADITKGFLENLEDEGENSIKTLGDKNALPTDEQLKQERYLQKIQWCIQNSFKIHEHEINLKPSTQTTIELFLSIARNGSLKELHIVKSSGIHELDRFMIFAFKDASSSFPPMPTFIKKDPFSIIYIVEINKHTYRRPFQLLR